MALLALAYYPFRYQTLAERKKNASRRAQATITSLLPLSADSAVSALEATKLILARAESLEASRKAESLDGLN